jgi:hypothetical protein
LIDGTLGQWTHISRYHSANVETIKKDKHGAPFVDDEDVPEELKSTSAPPKENEYDTMRIISKDGIMFLMK